MSEADVSMKSESKKKKKETKKEKKGASASVTVTNNESTVKEENPGRDVEMEEKSSDKPVALSAIARPLASAKLQKKCFKLIKKASKTKSLRRGVKEVVKAIRKGEKGVLFIAGNITPIDVITHLPILCEDNEIPYVYVQSKEELGAAGSTKRPTSCVLVTLRNNKGKEETEHKEYYEEVKKEVEKVAIKW